MARGSWMPLRWSISVLLPAPFGPDQRDLLARARSRRSTPLQRLEAVRVAEVDVLELDPRAALGAPAPGAGVLVVVRGGVA